MYRGRSTDPRRRGAPGLSTVAAFCETLGSLSWLTCTVRAWNGFPGHPSIYPLGASALPHRALPEKSGTRARRVCGCGFAPGGSTALAFCETTSNRFARLEELLPAALSTASGY